MPTYRFFVPTYSLKPLKRENLLSMTPKTEFELTFPTRKVFFIFSKFPLMAVNFKKLYVPSYFENIIQVSGGFYDMKSLATKLSCCTSDG